MSEKTKKRMTQWGVGPKFTIISAIYSVFIVLINYIFLPILTIPIPRLLSLVLGIILIIIGVPIFLIPGLTIHKYFNEGKLATKGVYAYFRHPIYGSWIAFIVPGVVLMLNSLLGLTVPFFMYGVFKVLIREEEEYLEGKFGEEYFEYKRKVGSIFPKFISFFRKKDK